jgi:hypothetical protein
MQAVKPNRKIVPRKSFNILLSIVIILTIIIVISLYISNLSKAFKVTSLPKGTAVISQTTLEDKYGLHVNLVALTAAGGFVDVRLKIVDGEKSKLLLADKESFPALYTGQGVILNAPEETKSQEIKFITGWNLFIIYPNSGNAVNHDTQVTILFGNTALEPINPR